VEGKGFGQTVTVSSGNPDDILLDVRNLKMHFPIAKRMLFQQHVGDVKAVDDVSFTIRKGEVLGLWQDHGRALHPQAS
jgi:ABC-type glutathione transport system ATPase component